MKERCWGLVACCNYHQVRPGNIHPSCAEELRRLVNSHLPFYFFLQKSDSEVDVVRERRKEM